MKKGRIKKHNIDIMFLMVLFLIFTFSAVSVLLMAVNSYRNVALANESNSNLRIATSYIREMVKAHDSDGDIEVTTIDDIDCIKMSEGDGYSLYIYEYQGCLMELESKDGAGITADFGNKILDIDEMTIEKEDNIINIHIKDSTGDKQDILIGIKSH